MKRLLENYKLRLIINWGFIISCGIMTGMLSLRGRLGFRVLGVILSFGIMTIINFKYKLLDKILNEITVRKSIISLIFTIVLDYYLLINFYYRYFTTLKKINMLLSIPSKYNHMITKIIVIILGLLSMFSIFILFLYILDKTFKITRNFLLGLSDTEKIYLFVISIIATIAITYIFNITEVFYSPKINGNIIYYDVIYTTDSGNQVLSNVYLDINAGENDIRQPLFGVYAMPFAILATVISKILYFIPNLYPIIINIIQVILLQVAMVLISRMLKLKSKNQILFLIMSTLTYPTLLYSLNMEQYIFPVFWMILFVYSILNEREFKEYYFIGASGSMITSVVLFPLLVTDKKVKKLIKEILDTGIKFLGVIIIFGQVPIILDSITAIQRLMSFTGGFTFYEKWLQYLNFIKSCFIKPSSIVDITTYEHVSYQLSKVYSVDIIGLGLLILIVLGFILNYKDKFIRICFGWSVFSFILLCVIGWGTKENGLVLYSLYFSWAFLVIIYKLIYKIFGKTEKFKYVISILIILILIAINIPGIYEVIKFGVEYYPNIKY